MRIINTLLFVIAAMGIVGLLGHTIAACFHDHDTGVAAAALLGAACGPIIGAVILIRHLF